MPWSATTPVAIRIAVVALLGLVATGGASEQGGGAAPYPHEPPGAVVLMDYDTDFGSVADPPWGYISGSDQLSTVTDARAPVAPGVVGRVRFAAGCCDGTGPARLETYVGAGRGTPPDDWARWYVSDWIKYDANFRPHACCHKIFEFYIRGPGAGTWVIVKADPIHEGTFPLQPRITTEYEGQEAANWSHATFTVRAGTWYQYEVIVHRTGRLQLWVRPQGGTSTRIYDGTPPGMGTPRGSFVFWWWGYGGRGAYPAGSGPGYVYHNHIRVSYTP